MKTAHFLWLGWLAFAVVGSAHAAPLLTGHFEAENQGVTLTGPPAQGQGNGQSNDQNSSFSFVHELHNGELEKPTFSGGKITLKFKKDSGNWSRGAFNLSIGGTLIAQRQNFAESVEVAFDPAFLVEPEFTNPTVLIERTNAAGSVRFLRSQLEFSGLAAAPSAASADVTSVPTPGSLFLWIAGLLATGLLAGLTLLRRRWR